MSGYFKKPDKYIWSINEYRPNIKKKVLSMIENGMTEEELFSINTIGGRLIYFIDIKYPNINIKNLHLPEIYFFILEKHPNIFFEYEFSKESKNAN